ncbi:YjbE family putative metal transport protein [Zavarzinia compransoris]|uniref:YjbE family putative metal transport protein n=1 Tax=Zavarzinia marina TaxID=2911065 RepID=UPI001EEC8850|nr:YjbE family putative metal transport protein [Zavarzinia marina]MCF4165350.1 YjbE family putative metal transport protein [Zavarzinia marina]
MDWNLLTEQLVAFGGIVLVDLVMAGDNAIVIGIAASAVAPEMRRKVIFWGLVGAMVMRIGFAAVTTELMGLIGLTLAGGLLLLWVSWKMWREIEAQRKAKRGEDAEEEFLPGEKAPTTFRGAVGQIILADVSMSLDNVLAVAGIAKEHLWVLAAGLILSIALMGAAATLVAQLLKRYHWIAYVGLAVVTYVALDMIYRGTVQVVEAAT